MTTLFYGACQGMPQFGLVVDNLAGVLAGASSELDAFGQLPAEAMEAALGASQAWRRTPGASVWYSLPMVEGRRPG